MDYRYLGNSGLKISEITYGNWLTHGSQVENDVATAVRARGPRRRHHHLRHRRRLRQHQGRDRARRGAARASGASRWRSSPRSTGRPGPSGHERHRPVPQAHHGVDQRLADAAADRLRRPLPGAPLRHRDAARGDDAGVRRRRPPGQGALHRRQRVDGRADPRRSRARQGARRPAHLEPAAVLDAVARHRGRGRADLRRSSASRRSSGRPIAQGVLTGKYLPGQPPPGGLAGHRREGRRRHDQALHERRRARRACRSSSRSPTSSGSRWPSSPSPGCCRTTTSPPRSSAPRAPSRSPRTSRPPASRSSPS